MKSAAFFAYADNYLIGVKFGIFLDVEASRAIRTAEVGAARTMIERTEGRLGSKPALLAADTAYGSAPKLDWLVEEKGIAPHIPVIDKSARDDGTFSRSDFRYDARRDIYICPAGKRLATTDTVSADNARLMRSPAATGRPEMIGLAEVCPRLSAPRDSCRRVAERAAERQREVTYVRIARLVRDLLDRQLAHLQQLVRSIQSPTHHAL